MRHDLLLPILAAGVLTGCGGGEERPTRTACPPVGDAAVASATEHYVRNVEPRAHRYMVMVGTDSTLPDAARRVLQDRGPTYLYPADAEQQAGLRQRLMDTGSWTTLLVVLRESEQLDRRRAEVEMGGHYITGLEGSDPAATMRVPLQCVNGTWTVTDGSMPERAS